MVSPVKKVLIIGPSWVGDMVMAQSLFIELKNLNTDIIIDVLAPSWSLPILERMPEVRQGISMPVGHDNLQWGVRYQLGKRLAVEGYDQAILLPNSWKSALVPFFADIPKRTGWRGEMRFGLVNDIRLLIKRNYPLMVQRFVALAHKPGAKLPENLPRPALVINPDNIPPLMSRFNISQDMPLLALCPGAEFGPAKRWPEQYYGEVAKTYIEKGWQVALFGSANDHDVAEAITQGLSVEQKQSCVNLAGKTELAEAVDLLSAASAVVSNDSGLMHIAAALSRPMVVVYGSTSPSFTPPLSDNVSVVQMDVDCGPCFKRECPLPEKRSMHCLKDLKPQLVINQLETLL